MWTHPTWGAPHHPAPIDPTVHTRSHGIRGSNMARPICGIAPVFNKGGLGLVPPLSPYCKDNCLNCAVFGTDTICCYVQMHAPHFQFHT
ncbi:hypothetical protein TIFTF001_000968 [Ficus carica]|uniref:Uncharacterized protein n=1 Tax=Ficus carica TaxID=3494 RepID=A0AA87Z4B4_FICCA|nr:hypothetical protein TIFTF001_000968 [Ficus carica]